MFILSQSWTSQLINRSKTVQMSQTSMQVRMFAGTRFIPCNGGCEVRLSFWITLCQNQAKSDEGFHDVESSKPCSVDGMI